MDGSDIRGAQALLIKTSKLEGYKEKFTEEDFKSFERAVKRARQDVDLHKKYLSNTEIIKHYSSVERVMKKIPQFELIHDWEVEALVQEAIWTTKYWYMNDLYYQYALFLPDCELVKRSTHTGCTWELAEDPTFIKQKFISEDATFIKNKFNFLTSFKIAYGLNQYFDFMSNLSFWGKKKAIENYNNYISRQRKLKEEEYLKRMNMCPIGFETPIHFLVHQERDEGCCIQEPLLEITKIRAYFGGFSIIPTDMCLDLEWRTAYRTFMQGFVKLEEGPMGEVEFEEPVEEAESEEEEEPVESENKRMVEISFREEVPSVVSLNEELP